MSEYSFSENDQTLRTPSRRSYRNDTEDEEGLSEIELKNKLFEAMKNKGILDSMKSQLRNKLVLEFNSNFAEIKHVQANPDTKAKSNLALNTVNSLLINHLKSSGYDYTLSVFMPECGLNISDAYTLYDIFQILKISNQSRLYKELNESNVFKTRGLLWFLVNYFCSHYVTNDASVQTEPYGHMKTLSSLDYKLKHLEKQYSDKYDQLNINGSLSIEEKILAHQKRIEEKAKIELEEKLNEFKEIELKKYKNEQNEKLRIELETMKNEYDKSYQARFNSLIAKEKNIEELVKQKHELDQRELFTQRQQLLEELKQLREREMEFKRYSESQTRSFETDLAKFKKYEDEFKKREFQLKLAENDFEQRLRTEREKVRFDVERSFAQREFLLQSIENKNKEDSKKIEIERNQFDKMKKELQANQIKINELELELQKSRAQALSLLNENNLLKDKLAQCLNYDIIKEENNYMKAQLETIKIHLGENYLQKHNQIKPVSSKSNENKSAFKVVQRKRSVTFANENNENQNGSINLQDLSNNSECDNEAYELGDKLLTVADNQLLLEKKIEEQSMANNKLQDLYEMQIYESRQVLNEVSDLKTNVKFLQHGIVLSDENELNENFPLNLKYNTNPKPVQLPTATIESVAFLESAKERIKHLEGEAEKIEKNYRDYQFRLTSSTYQPDEDSFTMKLKNKINNDSFDLNDILTPILTSNNLKNNNAYDTSQNVNSKNYENLKQISLELNEFKDYTKKSQSINEDLLKNDKKIPETKVFHNYADTSEIKNYNLNRENSVKIQKLEQNDESKSINPVVNNTIKPLIRENTFYDVEQSDESIKTEPKSESSVEKKKISKNYSSESESDKSNKSSRQKNYFNAQTYMAQLKETKPTNNNKNFVKTEISYENDEESDQSSEKNIKIEREASSTSDDDFQL